MGVLKDVCEDQPRQQLTSDGANDRTASWIRQWYYAPPESPIVARHYDMY